VCNRLSYRRLSRTKLLLREPGTSATDKIHLNPANDVFRRNHVHATRHSLHDVEAEIPRQVFLAAIPKRKSPGLPAPALFTARKRADSMQELVVWVGLPLRWFAPARNHNARPGLAGAPLRLNGCSQMHQKCHAAYNALSVIHEPYQLTNIR
jgi:hypothetical protein